MRLQVRMEYENGEIEDFVKEAKRRTQDYRPVFKKIREDLEEIWSNNFLVNGLESGAKWDALDPEYAAWKAKNDPNPMMMRSGKTLFRSLRNLKGKPNTIRKNYAVFGTDVPYAKFHQMGTSKMPRRQIVFDPRGANDKWGKWAVDYIQESEK